MTEPDDEDKSESLDFAVLREVKSRLDFVSNVTAWIGSCSKERAEKIISDSISFRAWAEHLEDRGLRRLYLKWIDFAVRGAKEALKEISGGKMKREMDEYHRNQARVFGPVEQLRRELPKPPTR